MGLSKPIPLELQIEKGNNFWVQSDSLGLGEGSQWHREKDNEKEKRKISMAYYI